MEEYVINNPNGLNELEFQIYSVVKTISQECLSAHKGDEKRTNKWLTKKIKEEVGLIGFNRNLEVASSHHNKEVLFDLTFLEKDAVRNTKKLVLALESELSFRNDWGLKDDFEKLLYCNAEQRVMICFGKGNYHHPKNVNSIIQLFNRMVEGYDNLSPDSRTLALIFEDYKTGNIFPHLIIKK